MSKSPRSRKNPETNAMRAVPAQGSDAPRDNAYFNLQSLSRHLDQAISVRGLRRRIRRGQIRALRTAQRGSGRYLVPNEEVIRLIAEMENTKD